MLSILQHISLLNPQQLVEGDNILNPILQMNKLRGWVTCEETRSLWNTVLPPPGTGPFLGSGPEPQCSPAMGVTFLRVHMSRALSKSQSTFTYIVSLEPHSNPVGLIGNYYDPPFTDTERLSDFSSIIQWPNQAPSPSLLWFLPCFYSVLLSLLSPCNLLRIKAGSEPQMNSPGPAIYSLKSVRFSTLIN